MEECSQPNAKQTKRQWSLQEDSKLVECLVELVATPWKCENRTFKPGYAKQLERMINEKLPSCGLKASPHIESRVKMLKKHCFAIIEMMGPAANGFGWNDKDKMIVVEKEIFNEWVKSHPNATGLYNKPFPHFEELGVVFGKDRAQGANAEDSAQAVAALEAELQTQLNDMHVHESTYANVDEIEAEFESNSQLPESEHTTPAGVGSSSAQERKKRKRGGRNLDVVESLAKTIDKLASVYQESSGNLHELVSCFKHEKEAEDKRMNVTNILKEIDGLSIQERVRAGRIITEDKYLTNYLFTLVAEDRMVLVLDVLS